MWRILLFSEDFVYFVGPICVPLSKSGGERESEEGRKRAGSLSVFSAPWDSLLLLGA